MAFRSKFKTLTRERFNWFPGHMDKGMKQMQHKLRSVDLIIEVHDARIPLSGRNNDFKYKIGNIKPHILVLNKVDMIPKNLVTQITSHLCNDHDNILFTNCKDQYCKGVKQLFPLAQKLINNSDRFNRQNMEDYNIMIIGVPNVGKSSLVNSLRNRFLHKANASNVGASPGITRSVLNKIKICDNPLFYMFDTPGVLQPSINNTEDGLKLALCNCLLDHLVGEEIIAEYLLFWLNLHEQFEYVKFFQLEQPVEDILVLLANIATKNNQMLKFRDTTNCYVRRPDLKRASALFINAFRNCQLGRIMLDVDNLNS